MKTKNLKCKVMTVITWNEALDALDTMVASVNDYSDLNEEISRLEEIIKQLKIRVAVREVASTRNTT